MMNLTPDQIARIHAATTRALEAQRIIDEASAEITAILGSNPKVDHLIPSREATQDDIVKVLGHAKKPLQVPEIVRLLDAFGLRMEAHKVSKALWRMKGKRVTQDETANGRKPWVALNTEVS